MVKTVTMDLNCYYPIVARELFPNAQIVIDRFHMVQMLTRSFNSLRVQTMKLFKKQSREYKLLKSTWKLYLMKYDKLNKTTPYYDWHFKDHLTQEHVVLNTISSKYSNGCLEGVNRKIKQIERTAYGYSNFRHLLIRIRLEENIIKEKRTKQLFSSCLILIQNYSSTEFDKKACFNLFLMVYMFFVSFIHYRRSNKPRYSYQNSYSACG